MCARQFVSGLLVLGLSTLAAAEDKKNANAKLIGSWVVVKADEGTVPTDTVVTFTKDGKFKVAAKRDGADVVYEGTYTTGEKSFTYMLKVDDEVKEQKITITKLSDDSLSTSDDKGKVVELKRKK